MNLREDSPLRRLPANLNSNQGLFLDGIRFSVEIAYLGHNRLQDTLINLTGNFMRGMSTTYGQGVVEALLDAWSIVDAINHLRELVQQMPHLRKKSPGMQIFLKQTAEIETFRNTFQHLRNEIHSMAETNSPVWGQLNWLVSLDNRGDQILTCSLISGTFRTGEHSLLNPGDYPLDGTISEITLLHNGKRLSITDLMKETNIFVTKFEKSLEKATIGQTPAGVDYVVIIRTKIDKQNQ